MEESRATSPKEGDERGKGTFFPHYVWYERKERRTKSTILFGRREK